MGKMSKEEATAKPKTAAREPDKIVPNKSNGVGNSQYVRLVFTKRYIAARAPVLMMREKPMPPAPIAFISPMSCQSPNVAEVAKATSIKANDTQKNVLSRNSMLRSGDRRNIKHAISRSDISRRMSGMFPRASAGFRAHSAEIIKYP